MSNVKFTKIDKRTISAIEIKSFGYSVIDNIQGDIIDLPTGKRPEMKRDQVYLDDAILSCTQRDRIRNHIDIFSTDATITYDLGKEMPIQKAIIVSYFHNSPNYTLGEFKLYASNERDTLYDDCNEVVHEIGRDHYESSGEVNNADWGYDVEGSFRYFGVKIIDSNPTDDITRLGYIGLYNDDHNYSIQYLQDNFPLNILSMSEPKNLTDGRIFDEVSATAINGTESYTFSVTEYADLTDMWVIGSDNLTVSADGFGECDKKAIDMGRVAYRFKTKSAPIKKGEFTVNVSGNGYIEQIGAFSENRKVKVDFDNVICNDFLSIGANVLPMSFMPESLETGYNEVYWALESERIKKARPTVVRMWFQPDWLCETYEQYKNGEYDFECQKLQSVYRYLDVFKEIGTEVEFDFGWKVSSHAQEWFSLDIPNKANSAPRELDLFAKCCGATMVELIKNRNYDNIKYLTFYNEPDGGNFSLFGDFVVGDGIDRRPYWAEMLKKCADELKRVGLADIKLWICETACGAEGQCAWIDYMQEHCKGLADCYTGHKYQVSHSYTPELFDPIVASCGDVPYLMSECGQNYGSIDFDWNMNEVQLFHDLVKHKVCGALIWCLNGMPITDPCSFTMNNEIDFWGCPQLDGGIDNVRENYYRWAMLSRYIPNHSKSVVSSVVSGSEDNIRVSAFTHGDDYTVVLDLNNEVISNRNIEIDLGKHIGKKFYKHVYRIPQLRDGNATLPPAVAEIYADDTLCDTVNSDYQEVVYTTIPPVVQVALPQNEVFLKECQKYLLSGTVIDGNGDIDFELCATVGDGAVFDGINRTVRFNENAKAGDMFAIKATAKNHPTATSVVIFKYLG